MTTRSNPLQHHRRDTPQPADATATLGVPVRDGTTGCRSERDSYPVLGDYALLADCHSAALVSRGGSIDWACLRRFDAASMFGRLLDWQAGGYFHIEVSGTSETSRSYVRDSLVLQTDFACATGLARVVDAFVMRPRGGTEPPHELVRRVEVLSGSVPVSVTVEPRFDYGLLRPWIRRARHGAGWTVIGGDDGLFIDSDAPLELDEQHAHLVAHAWLSCGDVWRFSLHPFPAHRLGEVEEHVRGVVGVDGRLADTLRWWRRWSARTVAQGPHAAVLRRSAVVLKGLTCAPTGAVVAAPTTSLPEMVGGPRNWDYRYAWVRDSSLTLAALSSVGHAEVAAGFRDFLMRSAAGHAADLQIMYGTYGEHRLPEVELPLAGYRGSVPVRVGNAAAGQRQLDVYGHILDAAHWWHTDGHAPDEDEWRFLRQVVDEAARAWTAPDQGIWESRGRPRHRVYSKVMCWVALDRGMRIAASLGHAAEVDLGAWAEVRAAIAADVLRHGVTADGHFTAVYGRDEVDASLLLLSAVGFVDAHDPRMVATVAEVRRRLTVSADGLVCRYRAGSGEDGLPGGEDAFLVCTCWLVDALVRQGAVADAARVFDGLLATGNDLGLFSEQYDPTAREPRGNFPQAFTHLGIIQSALLLQRAQQGIQHVARTSTSRGARFLGADGGEGSAA